MKKILSFVLLVLIVLNFPTEADNVSRHKVLKVVDGDTVYIDFNDNGITEKDEKVRINGIDTFETKINQSLKWQIENFNLTQNQVLGMGYLAKEYAKKELLNKYVTAKYTGETERCDMGRHLMSIYYGTGKNYEQEILKAGLGVVYTKSNLAPDLEKYCNREKLERNFKKAEKLDLVILNTKNSKYHKVDCEYGQGASHQELIRKPIFRYKPAGCCYIIPQKAYKRKYLKPKADIKDGKIELYFLNPLKQKKPENKCKSNACKALRYNIDNAKESIDFAIYGIQEQDAIFDALVNAQNRGVKIRWVTDLTENGKNIYYDTYKLMKKLPNYNTDYDSLESRNIPDYKYKLDFQGALMHNKFFIFDKKIVFTGSTNTSSTCLTGYNSNVAIILNSPTIADVYEQEFEQMYNGHFHNEKTPVINNENINLDNIFVSVYFSPLNKAITTQIIPLIQHANKYIYIPTFYLTHKGIIEELINAKKRGLDIKVIVDQTSVEGKYVDINYIKNNGIDLKVENWAGKMHQKTMIIDDNILVIGSMNFTKQGEKMNDENCLIIKNSPKLVIAYKNHFTKLWNSIKNLK